MLRPGNCFLASNHARAEPATKAISVATVATVNESLIGNQLIMGVEKIRNLGKVQKSNMLTQRCALMKSIFGSISTVPFSSSLANTTRLCCRSAYVLVRSGSPRGHLIYRGTAKETVGGGSA